MKSAIELHDSECLAIELDSRGNGAVILDAYVRRTDGEPGLSQGEGGVQRVRIAIESMTTTGEIGSLPATICDGSLTLDNTCVNELLALPSVYEGDLSLSLTLLDDGRSVSVSGRSASITPEDPFRFVEQVDLR